MSDSTPELPSETESNDSLAQLKKYGRRRKWKKIVLIILGVIAFYWAFVLYYFVDAEVKRQIEISNQEELLKEFVQKELKDNPLIRDWEEVKAELESECAEKTRWFKQLIDDHESKNGPYKEFFEATQRLREQEKSAWADDWEESDDGSEVEESLHINPFLAYFNSSSEDWWWGSLNEATREDAQEFLRLTEVFSKNIAHLVETPGSLTHFLYEEGEGFRPYIDYTLVGLDCVFHDGVLSPFIFVLRQEALRKIGDNERAQSEENKYRKLRNHQCVRSTEIEFILLFSQSLIFNELLEAKDEEYAIDLSAYAWLMIDQPPLSVSRTAIVDALAATAEILRLIADESSYLYSKAPSEDFTLGDEMTESYGQRKGLDITWMSWPWFCPIPEDKSSCGQAIASALTPCCYPVLLRTQIEKLTVALESDVHDSDIGAMSAKMKLGFLGNESPDPVDIIFDMQAVMWLSVLSPLSGKRSEQSETLCKFQLYLLRDRSEDIEAARSEAEFIVAAYENLEARWVGDELYVGFNSQTLMELLEEQEGLSETKLMYRGIFGSFLDPDLCKPLDELDEYQLEERPYTFVVDFSSATVAAESPIGDDDE